MMAENSSIEWTTHTFSPWRGCTRYSPGCENCYAEMMSKRNPKMLGVWGPMGTRIVAAESYWKQPIKWNHQSASATIRPRVFCASLSDVFEEWKGSMRDANAQDICACHECGKWMNYISRECDCRNERAPRRITMDHVRVRLMKLIAATPNLDWLLLTKRPENVVRILGVIGLMVDHHDALDLSISLQENVWLGTSVENRSVLHRIDTLRKISAAVRFLSIEPLLEDLGEINLTGIDWLIVGCESGSKRRPMRDAWAASLSNQCAAQGVKFFMKQMDMGVDMGAVTGDIERFPLGLRVREFPNV